MQHHAPPSSKPPRSLVLQVAGVAGVDPRSAARALIEGPLAVRGLAGERLARAIPAIDEARELLERRVAEDLERLRERVAAALSRHGSARTSIALHVNAVHLVAFSAGETVSAPAITGILANRAALDALDLELDEADPSAKPTTVGR